MKRLVLDVQCCDGRTLQFITNVRADNRTAAFRMSLSRSL